jgi:hypothetical protein
VFSNSISFFLGSFLNPHFWRFWKDWPFLDLVNP